MKAAYLDSLKKHSLLETAAGARPDPAPVGGLSQEATDEHYAHQFDGSVARAQLALLDPKGEVATTSNTLLQFFSGGTLCFIDVPSGAGAAALAIISSIAELRAQGVLPRQPLYVELLQGEISAPARSYADELMHQVSRAAAEQAIFVKWSCFSWDVLCEVSNASLVEKIVLAKQNSLQTLLLISNFNGFLEQSKKKKEAQPQISELFKYSSGKMNAAVWIEPQMSAAKLGLFPFLMEKVLSKLPAFAKSVLGGSGNEETSFAFAPPMKMEKSVIVRLCVMPVELVKGSL
ncbi:hypothetical protein [Sphingomonas molluscorum]|uniref:hypothetical protein n=1 Tax=Sphingomonas molluscorum TaxID=418184 RepID=UPI0031D57E3F